MRLDMVCCGWPAVLPLQEELAAQKRQHDTAGLVSLIVKEAKER